MLALDASREGVRLTGLAGPASLSRATTALQSFVVNGRPVLDPVLRMALRLAYRDVIAAGRHPVAALRLEVPAEALDVNVHPAKTELRFADANGVRSLVMGAISRLLDRPVSLGTAPTAPLAPFSPAAPLAFAPAAPSPRWGGTRRPGLAPPSDMPATAASRGFAEAELALLAPPSARQIAAPAPDPAHPLGAPVAQIFDTSARGRGRRVVGAGRPACRP